MIRIIFTIATLLFVLVCQSQEAAPDSTEISSTRKVRPSIYLDYGKLITYALDNDARFEAGLEFLLFEKIPLLVEAGYAERSPQKAYANANYTSNGQYVRIGTGFYTQLNPKNKFGITFRYGLSSFDEEATIDSDKSLNLLRTLNASYDRIGLSAQWLEAVLYTDRQLNHFLSVGMNLRWRYLLDYDIQAPDDVYFIPGYGRSFDDSIPAANLFLKVSF